MADKKLLRVDKLVLHFRAGSGVVQAVDGVDFDLDYNRAVVILGESGCGKSSLAKAILRLLPRNVASYGGQVFLEGKDVMSLSATSLFLNPSGFDVLFSNKYATHLFSFLMWITFQQYFGTDTPPIFLISPTLPAHT